MELRPKDTYRVECSAAVSEDFITSLVSLYQPLIGTDAVALYLLLHSEGRAQRTQETHARLSAVLGQSIEDIERARIHLEEFQLVRTYALQQDSRTSYVYRLNPPLPVHNFLESREFMGMYAHAVGRKNAELTIAKFSSGSVSTSGMKDITRKVTRIPAMSDYDPSVQYSTLKPRYNFEKADQEINFDYDHFFATTTTLVFPAELRTQENLALIGRLGTIYGLSADKMRILTGRCVRLDSMTFDAEKLKLLAQKAKPDITTAKDIYSLPPASFLQAKQNGAPVSAADKKLLEYLSVDMHFAPDVINIMVEYILKRSQNRLVKAFVEMVAGEWARDGVKTRTDAVAETKKHIVPAEKQKEVLPEWYRRQIEGTEEKQDHHAMSEEERAAAQEFLRKMGNQNGKA